MLVVADRIGHAHARVSGETKPESEVDILEVAEERRLEAANLHERLPAVDRSGAAGGEDVEVVPGDCLLAMTASPCQSAAVQGIARPVQGLASHREELHGCEARSRRVATSRREHRGVPTRAKRHVGVEDRDQVARCRGDAEIRGRGEPDVSGGGDPPGLREA